MRAIEKRGRTFDALAHPGRYAPFAGIDDRAAFDRLWRNRPDLIFAHCSHAAYLDGNALAELFEPFGAEVSCYDSGADAHGWKHGSQAFLARWPDRVVLAFRGTEPDEALIFAAPERESHHEWSTPLQLPFIPTDIVDDLNFLPVTFRAGAGEAQLHRGFYQATQRIWPQLAADLKRLDMPQSQCFATGHSLGAAMAVIAGLQYGFARIVTFGEPRVGRGIDAVIAPACTHIRYVNGRDPVTSVVPERLYQHHGIARHITDIDGADVRYDHSIINYAAILGRQG